MFVFGDENIRRMRARGFREILKTLVQHDAIFEGSIILTIKWTTGERASPTRQTLSGKNTARSE